MCFPGPFSPMGRKRIERTAVVVAIAAGPNRSRSKLIHSFCSAFLQSGRGR